jgi:hypothetical protein
VVEIGLSQNIAQLGNDASRWLTNFGSRVRVIVPLDINEAARSLTIETWRSLPNAPKHAPQLSNTINRHQSWCESAGMHHQPAVPRGKLLGDRGRSSGESSGDRLCSHRPPTGIIVGHKVWKYLHHRLRRGHRPASSVWMSSANGSRTWIMKFTMTAESCSREVRLSWPACPTICGPVFRVDIPGIPSEFDSPLLKRTPFFFCSISWRKLLFALGTYTKELLLLPTSYSHT